MSNDLSSNNINLELTELEEPRSPMERRLTVDVHDHIIDRALELVDISRNIPDSVRLYIYDFIHNYCNTCILFVIKILFKNRMFF